MPFNLLLLPLIGGYYFFKEWDKTSFEAKRVEKERLLIQSSFYGVVLLAVSFFASSLIPYSSILTELQQWWAYHTPPIQYSGISAFALVLGYISPRILNALTRGDFRKFFERVLSRYGSQLELMLYRSLVQNKRVMVTLKSGKVYIGRVTISLRPQEDRDFILLPSMSGYRDEKQRLVLTTDYDLVYESILENEEDYVDMIEDFGVVIPLSEVVTASLYREDVHTKYFAHHDARDTSSETPSETATKQLNRATTETLEPAKVAALEKEVEPRKL